uniref:Sporulation related domain-containing protein n=1 Tax=Candidatus Kentrum sp. SD TaxID=2126332 RepID=A0A450Z4R3_9GAMM|nr:MAG: Sporulation related domain-containing protein [Candidatus Kentron sp. SD]VFK48800.1 MAG: Sporulation related domain-containing protein [Candidatus Kentron sp. SD]
MRSARIYVPWQGDTTSYIFDTQDMKWVFYLLVAINIGYFVWQGWYLEPSVAPLAKVPELSLPTEVERPLLFHEVDPDKLRLRASATVSHVPHEEPSPAAAATSHPLREKSPPAATTSQPVAKPRPDAQLAAASPEPAKARSDEEDEHDAPICYKIGPVSKKAKIEAIHAWIEAREDITTTSRTRQQRDAPLHWVYFPAFATRSEASDYAEHLKEDGITDLYVLSKGKTEHLISVGIFRQRESVKKRVAELQEKGYTPSVGLRPRTLEVTWFHIAATAKAIFSEIDLKQEFPSLEMAPADCADINLED